MPSPNLLYNSSSDSNTERLIGLCRAYWWLPCIIMSQITSSSGRSCGVLGTRNYVELVIARGCQYERYCQPNVKYAQFSSPLFVYGSTFWFSSEPCSSGSAMHSGPLVCSILLYIVILFSILSSTGREAYWAHSEIL